MNSKCKGCEGAKQIIQEWVDKQGHDRCWYYPELFIKLADIFDVKMNTEPKLPPRTEFEEGCRRFQNGEYANRK